MLMEMPFVKTLVTAPFRETQSEKMGACNLFQCESDFRNPRAEVGSQCRKVRKQATVKLFGQERLIGMHANTFLKSWLFSDSFLWRNFIFQRLQILNESVIISEPKRPELL